MTSALDPAPVRPRAEGLNCPSCGAGVVLRANGFAETVACESCGSVLDATDPNLSVLQRHELRLRSKPRIPLGTRGEWHGAPWEAVGFQVVAINVDGIDYAWTEYVLFNPYRGFLYLSEYEGHWNVIEKLRRRPVLDQQGGRAVARLDGATFKHFQTAEARTTFAIGEFPWELRVGDRVGSRDYVAPPYILSAEASDEETTWSLGTYTEGEAIARAFGIDRKELVRPQGVFANQPNPHTRRAGAAGRMAVVFVALLFAMGMLNYGLAANDTVVELRHRFDRASGANAAWVAGPYQITGRTSNVEIEIETESENDWAFFVLTLIDDSTGVSRELTKQVSYYTGTDSDGRWKEGSRRGRVRFARVPAGRYILRIGEEGGEPGRTYLDYILRVKRDVPRFGFYGLALLAIVVPALLLWIPAASFEQQRWAESDYSGGSGASDDEDDE